MKIIGRPRLLEWMRLHSETKSSLQSWLREVEVASWSSAQEIRERYRSVEILSDETVVFVLGDNLCRLQAHLCFAAGALLVVKMTAYGMANLPLQNVEASNNREMLEGEAHDN